MSRSTGLPFKICYVCGVKITKHNTAGINNGKPQPCCKPCHAEVSYCKLWRKKSINEIRSGIFVLERRIMVLSKIIQRRLVGFPKAGEWKAKMNRQKKSTKNPKK